MQGSWTDRRGTRRPLLLAVPLALVASLALASTASAAVLLGGTTTLEVKSGTAKKLSKAGVKIKPAAGATKSGSAFSFAIAGGTLDRGDQYTEPTAASGTVRHDSGLKFKCKGGKVQVTELLATVGATSALSGTSKGSLLRLADLNTSDAVVTDDGLDVANAKAKFAKQFRKKLRKACDVDVKKRTLGTIHVDATAELTVFSGSTTLAPEPAFVGKLIGMQVAPSALAPATLDGSGFHFPITGGTLNPSTFVGKIEHDGGIQLDENPADPPPTQAQLEDPAIDLTGPTAGTLSMFSVSQGTRASLFNVTITGTPSVSGGQLTATAELRMNAVAAASLNAAFSDGAEPTFSDGELVGTGQVTATVG